ncbi:MAG: hypothetical protein SGJ18_01300 [Pseudomonadota bacterium]|nr:hypothetical protein [Pseudomonadota bacterium]
MRTKNKILVSVATLLTASGLMAEEFPPRGPDIDQLAGNCAIGPFEQTEKAGRYNPYCHLLTDSEKCLAYIKGHMSPEGVVNKAGHQEKAQFCLDTFKKDLILEE